MTRPSILAVLGLMFLVSACSDNDDTPVVDLPGADESAAESTTKIYQVTLQNLTNDQPFSPPLLVIHTDDYRSFEPGDSVSNELENLAESGNAVPLHDSLDNLPDGVIFARQVGEGPVASGTEQTYMLELDSSDGERVTVLTMLVNTNDAITGVNSVDVANLEAGQSLQVDGIAWDAGTEKNDELATTIPGPAAGGEGYLEDRNDVDFVSVHPGVVSLDAGLSTSVLTEAHRFDNIVARLRIERIQ